MKDKILFVGINFFSPEYLDGGNKIIYNLLKRLNHNREFELHYLSLMNGSITEDESKDFDNIQIHDHCNSFSMSDIKIRRLMNWALKNRSKVQLPKKHCLFLASKINQISSEYEIIHLTSLNLASLAPFLTEDSLSKSVLSAVDCYSMYMERRVGMFKNFIKKFLGKIEISRAKRFEDRAYSIFPKVIFVSDVDKDYANKHFRSSNKLFSIPLGVDTEYFSPGTVQDIKKNTILFSGNMSYAPNTDAGLFLIKEVFPLVLKHHPEAKLIIAGSNPPKEFLAFSKSNINITGRVPDLRTYLRSASLFVSPLRFGAGMKYKILEAMALGKTIIGSKLSMDGIVLPNSEGCQVISGFEPDQWAAMISDNLRKASSQEIQHESREHIIKNYSWDSMKEQYLSVYRT